MCPIFADHLQRPALADLLGRDVSGHFLAKEVTHFGQCVTPSAIQHFPDPPGKLPRRERFIDERVSTANELAPAKGLFGVAGHVQNPDAGDSGPLVVPKCREPEAVNLHQAPAAADRVQHHGRFVEDGVKVPLRYFERAAFTNRPRDIRVG